LHKLPSLADENPSQRSLAACDFNRFCKIVARAQEVLKKQAADRAEQVGRWHYGHRTGWMIQPAKLERQ
jgi:hypothetical protein